QIADGRVQDRRPHQGDGEWGGVGFQEGVESQRDSVIKPRVARNELPWEERKNNSQPQRGCVHFRNAFRDLCKTVLKGGKKHPTSNIEHPMITRGVPWMLGVGCWMLDVGCFAEISFNVVPIPSFH